jgi:hypothetical protein
MDPAFGRALSADLSFSLVAVVAFRKFNLPVSRRALQDKGGHAVIGCNGGELGELQPGK